MTVTHGVSFTWTVSAKMTLLAASKAPKGFLFANAIRAVLNRPVSMIARIWTIVVCVTDFVTEITERWDVLKL